MEAILVATAQILEREGPEAATTNAIAALAGVSIGTLYQYFEDREAIIEALAERHIEQLRALLSEALGDLMQPSLEDAITGLMDGLIAVHEVNPRLDQALFRLEPLSEVATADEVQAFATTMAAAALRMRPDLEIEDPERVAYMLTAAVGGVIRGTLRQRPGEIHEPGFRRGLVDLVMGFLERRRKRADPP
ncbi:TetR/AcrR family transcriptional regulator [Pseudenhygromyxa sp. WMMC2535]|uniref:TetR family transcriptional regulator n=1 Tax=Pseudenhygromyxa sp. WMMC2535 TaxID=2712867 RepID=UPI001553C844|nr:TetR/AcrR family transcriptional regulator [Pseudenhygromyxa sp. WMMC2535]